MARVLVAGCGYVGEAAASAFHERGWSVEGWTATDESATKLSQLPYPVRAVDVTSYAAVSNSPSEFDLIIYCVSSRGGDEEHYRRLYFDGARNLMRAFPKATLLFTSSTSVYPQTDGSVVDENSAAEPSHGKGKILRETETQVLAGGGIAARLGGIHGPHRSFFLTRFLAAETLPEGHGRFINQVHRDDIVSALLLLAERRVEYRGEIFNVVGDQPVTAKEAYAWLSARLNKSGAAFARAGGEGQSAMAGASGKLAPEFSAGGDTRRYSERSRGAADRKRGESNKQVSNRKLRALGWHPRYPTFQCAMSENILASFGF